MATWSHKLESFTRVRVPAGLERSHLPLMMPPDGSFAVMLPPDKRFHTQIRLLHPKVNSI